MANEVARSLRKRMTPQEVRVWLQLRQMRPQGLHFRRQVPIGTFVVDFACKQARLVIEIDGAQHGTPEGQRMDFRRDRNLEAAGYRVLRFWNVEVERNLDGVVETIFAIARARFPEAAATPPGTFLAK